ncbi:G kinase-anchoring protein 1 [Strongylocentrotus purpuratus]|uniref:G kinase-anchoring protein 1 n=1 Tax=Strongylocentrotus purpuratus TaxID=7668 RepID=A0A7M7RD46_STRPU|nr:G kinase-anchoring protein 1 [Strongylocentrotus purpuratus]|eukprot:XP_783496.2 PREDICTED: G kinase-anchoring protein 1 [Strongylocentrotus purpuratus]
MAAKPAMQLSSRFGVLRVDDSQDLDSDEDMTAQRRKEKEVKAAVEAAKKRAKKKKKAQQQSNTKNELREMAFTKIACVPKALASSPPVSKPVIVHPEVLKIGSPPEGSKDYEHWHSKDQEFVDGQYQHDIQRAILQSKLEFEKREKFMQEVGPEMLEAEDDLSKYPQTNRRERRKHLQGKEKPQPMSLQEFHQEASRGSGDVGLDEIELPQPPEENKEIFTSVKEEINRVMAKEKKKTRKKRDSESNEKHNQEIDSIRQVQKEDKLEKKTAEVTELHESIDQLKEELTQVKKRNKQLCFILGQGEMKDKAAVLIQVEELITEKDELTAEVAELYAALEQEKSKVTTLRAEIQKLHEKTDKKK